MMRQGLNSRRSRNRGPRGRQFSPRNQQLDSNGPEGRIRGTATQIYERYLALARDSQSVGDSVLAENLLQHAEHYFRLMALSGANAQQQGHQGQQQPYSSRDNGEQDGDFVDDGAEAEEPQQYQRGQRGPRGEDADQRRDIARQDDGRRDTGRRDDYRRDDYRRDDRRREDHRRDESAREARRDDDYRRDDSRRDENRRDEDRRDDSRSEERRREQPRAGRDQAMRTGEPGGDLPLPRRYLPVSDAGAAGASDRESDEQREMRGNGGQRPHRGPEPSRQNEPEPSRGGEPGPAEAAPADPAGAHAPAVNGAPSGEEMPAAAPPARVRRRREPAEDGEPKPRVRRRRSTAEDGAPAGAAPPSTEPGSA